MCNSLRSYVSCITNTYIDHPVFALLHMLRHILNIYINCSGKAKIKRYIYSLLYDEETLFGQVFTFSQSHTMRHDKL